MGKSYFRILGVLVLAGALGAGLTGCGSSTSSSEYTAIPEIAVTAITAAKTSTGVVATTAATATTPKNFKDVVTTISDRIAKTTNADCLDGLKATLITSTVVDCYGPSLYVKYHPDASPTPNPSPTILPSGDLGIWSATNSVTGEACAANKANNLVGDAGNVVNENLNLMAGMFCVARVADSSALSAVGDKSDVMATLNSGLTDTALTTATIELTKEDTTAGTKTFQTVVVGKYTGVTVSLTLTHTTNKASTEYSGRLTGVVDQSALSTSDPRQKVASYSLVYSQSSTTLKYLFKSGMSSAATTSMHDANGDVDFSSAAFEANGNYSLAEIDTSVGLGTQYFAWQAGSGDGYTRAFQTTGSTSGGTDTAYAYFGYGPELKSSTVGTISGMICNWAGPGNTRTVQTSKAQAQIMTRASGATTFTPSTSYITYAPTNSCDNTLSTFAWSTTETGTYTAFGTVTNDLVTYGSSSVGTIPTVTAPTYP